MRPNSRLQLHPWIWGRPYWAKPYKASMQSCLNWVDSTIPKLPVLSCMWFAANAQDAFVATNLPHLHGIWDASAWLIEQFLDASLLQTLDTFIYHPKKHSTRVYSQAAGWLIRISLRNNSIGNTKDDVFVCPIWCAILCYFASLTLRVLFSPAQTLQIRSGTMQPQPGELKAKELVVDQKIFGARLNQYVFLRFSMLFLHVICCWYYPWFRNPTAARARSRDESLRLLLYQLSLRILYCLACCDVGLGWLPVWFQEVPW